MSNAVMNQVYNYALNTYYPKVNSRYDTHKKSELRTVYNNMVKLNKESPIYLLKNPKESQAYAINIKENSRLLHNEIAALGNFDKEKLLDKKIAFSSNEDMITATYIGLTGSSSNPTFTLEVKAMAGPQVNLGEFLPDSEAKLPADVYSFDIAVNDLNYEFQFSIKEGQTNKSIQDRIAKLIQNADIGLNASVISTDNKTYALQIESTDTGVPEGKNAIFRVSDNHTSKRTGTVDYFGMDHISREPNNAHFLLNGEERYASSNTFTVGKVYEVQLKGLAPEEGMSATIGLKTDVDSFTDNVSKLVESYNSFVQKTEEFAKDHPASSKLSRELGSLISSYSESLSSLGLDTDESGALKMNEGVLRLIAGEDDAGEMFSPLKDFAASLVAKTEQISLDPMSYVDKTIVAYKKPGNNLNTPYVSSAYSGMLFNVYY